MDAISDFRTRVFFRRTLWSACFTLLFPFALLSSSSEADDIAPWRSVPELERLWVGVLGCADNGEDEETVRNALENDSVPGGAQRDYLDCGARALRGATSRMLVDTIENSLRWGGSNLFDREFRLDSSLAWEIDGNARGDLDAVIPIGGLERRDGTGRALFFQPGLVLWDDSREKLRSDFNAGVVYRGHVTPDLILGSSFFFDYNFRREHVRLSVGVDAQSDIFYGGLNYYFTLGEEWRRGRTGYEERALEGLDLHWSLAWERWRLDGSFGAWLFGGEFDGEGSGWRPSASVSTGYKIYSGVFLEAGYEHHDERSVDANWNLGLAFRYSLPEMKGIGGDGIGIGGAQAQDLWRVVDREKRILYEERLGRASAALEAASARVEEGESMPVRVVLSHAVEADVSFSLVAAPTGTADADDYALPSVLTIPAGALSAEAAVDIIDDDESEPDEILDLELRVGREFSLLAAPGNSAHTRIIIAASDNSVVGFAMESTSVREGIEWHVPLVLGEPAPPEGLVLVASSDKEEDVTADAETSISPGARDGQYVRVTIHADSIPEHAEIVRLVLSEPPSGLPGEWRIGRSEHMLMISLNDQTATFAEDSGVADEGDGDASFRVMLSADAPAGGVPLQVGVASGNADGDVTFATQSFVIAQGEREHALSVDINDDGTVEPSEVVTFSLSKGAGVAFPDEWGGLGAQTTFDLEIRDNDSASVGFTSPSSALLEGDAAAPLTVRLNGSVSQNVEVALNESGDGNNDLAFSPPALTFAPGETEKEVTLAVNAANNDNAPEADLDIAYRLEGTLPDGVRFESQEHVVTFIDDDKTIRFRDSSSSAGEGTSEHPVAVVLNFDPPAGGLGVAAVARSGHVGDVSIPSPELVFADGARELSVLVNVLEDEVREGAELVLLELEESDASLPAGWTLVASGADDHDLTIDPSDHTAMFAEAGRTAGEGDGTISFRVTLSEDAPAGGIPLEVAIASGNDDGDVTFTTQNFTIARGAREHTLTVDINEDSLVEPSETVTFTLSKDASAAFPDAWGDLGTQTTFDLVLTDNDSASVGFATTSSMLPEGGTTAVLTVSLAGSVSQDVVVTLTESGDGSNDLAFSPAALTFAPGETDKQVTLTVNAANNDAAPEADLDITYRLEGTLPGGVSFNPREHVVTFVDDDRTVRFRDSSSSVSEGVIGHPVAVVLNFDPPAEGLEVTAVARGAHAGDVSIPSPVLNFTGSTRELPVLVNVLADIQQEGSEIVLLELEEAAGASLPAGWTLIASGNNDHDLTILPSDHTAMFASAGSTVDEDVGTISFRVTLSEDAPAGGVPLEVAVTSGNENGDVAFATQRFTIAQGAREHTLTADINDDDLVEPSETVVFTLSKDASAVFPDAWGDLGTPATYRLTINPSDQAAIFAEAGRTADEGDGTISFRVTLSGDAPAGGVPLEVAITSGNDDGDVTFATQRFTIAQGAREHTLTVDINEDALVEPSETVVFTLSKDASAVFPDAWGDLGKQTTFDLVLTDNDSASVGFTTATSTLLEGGTTVVLTVLLAGSVSQDVTVALNESGDVNNDLAFSPASLTFAPGETSKEVTLTVNAANDDASPEGDVEITYALTGTLPDGVSFSTDSHVVTFVDDDKTIIFRDSFSSADEGTIGHPVAVELNFDPPAEGLEVMATATGVHAGDVSIPSPVLNFTGSTRELSVPVNVLEDNVQEGAEIVLIELGETATPLPAGWTLIVLGDSDHDLTIRPSDQTAMFAGAGGAADENAGTASFRVVLSADAPSGGVPLEVAVTSGNENNDVTFATQNFTIAEGGREHTLTVGINDDNLPELGEVVTFTLSKGAGAAFPEAWGDLGTQTTYELTINPSDQTAMFAEAGKTAGEGDGATSFQVTLSADAPAGGVPLEAAIASGNENGDVTFATQRFRIAQGTRAHTLTVDINEDALVEPSETVTFTLSKDASATFPDAWGDLGTQTVFDLVLTDNDSASVGFATASSSLLEGGATAVLTVSLAGTVSQNVDLTLTESGDVNNDLAFSPAALTFAPGETSKEVTLTVNAANDDASPEGDVEITYALTGTLPDGVSFSTDSHVVTFVDDDKTIIIRDSFSSADEGTIGHPVAVELNFDPPAEGLEVMATATGVHAGDVSIPSPVLNFTGTTRELSVPVNVLEDNVQEGAEIVFIELEETATPLPAGWTLIVLGDSDHDLTIRPSDQAATFVEAGRTVNEGDGTISFRVELSADAPAGGVPLEAAVTSGNGDGDVTFATQSFTIAQGAREHTLTVDINEDALVESDETVTFTLSKDASATFPDAWGDLGTQTTFDLVIRDNDSASIGFTTAASGLLEGGSTAVLTVSLAGSVSQDVTVGLSESGDVNNDLAFSPASLTFSPGETDKQVTLTVNAANDDALPEGDVEITYALTGTLPGGVSFAADSHVVTFVDDDKTVSFRDASSSASEGTVGHPVAVVLNFDPPATGLEVAAVATGDHAGDVTIPSPTLNFTGSTRELPVLVDILAGDGQEGAEIVLLELEETVTPLPAGWTLLASGANDHDLTILPNGQTAMFVEAGRTADEGDGTVSFQVELSADAPAGGVPLEVAVTSGNENNDVTFATQSFVIIEGERQHTLTVDVNDDGLVEPDETVTFTLSKDASAVFPDAWGGLGTPTTFELTITDNDSASVGFTTAASNLLEGGANAVLTVSMSNEVSQNVDLALNESGDVNNDLAFSPAALTFAPGETSKEVTLTVNAANDDALPEEDAEITYTLTGTLPNGVNFATRGHVVTFIDDDKTIRFRDASSSANEGTTGHPVAAVLNFDPPAGGLEVTATATGVHAGDVSIPSPALNFTGSTRELSVPVNVLEDVVQEGAEIVQLELQEGATPLPAGWTLLASGANDHDLTILPSDQTAMFAEAGRTVNEGDGTISFQVELSADAPAGGVPLEAAITSGNENGDVTFATQSFTIAEGARQHTLTVDVNDDGLVEPDETVTFTLSKDASATFPDAWGDLGTQTVFALVITDNDSASIGFAAAASSLLEGGTSGILTVSLAGSVLQNVDLTLTESGDVNNDLAFSPASLTFAPGETDKQVTLTVNAANDDVLPEGDVEITYTLTGTLPDGVSFATDSHVVTFIDDDKTVSFRDASSSASEGTVGHPVAVVLNFDPPADGLEVTATATGDHAADVSIPSPVLNFTGTTRELSVPVDVLADGVQEGEEIVLIELGETATPLPAGWTLLASGANDHDLTILPSGQTATFVEAGRTADEGDGTVSFQVELSADAPAGGVPLEVAVTSGNDDGDVTFTTQSFLIIEGERQHTLTVDVNDDGLVEPDETVTFTLSKDASAAFPDAWGDLGTQTTFELTIADNDSATVGFTTTASTLTEDDTAPVTLTVSMSNAVSQNVGVTLSESGDINNDIAFSPAALTFAPGETSKQVTLTVNAANNDTTPEGDVAVTYTLTGTFPDNVGFAADSHVVTFIDNDRTISFRDASSSANEGTTGHPVAVVLNFDPPAGGLEVTATATGDHAADVSIPSPTLNFTGTTRELSVPVDVLADGVQEGEEIVLLELGETATPLPAGWTLLASGGNDHDLTILPSDQTAMFAESGRTADEGDGTISFQVTLSADAPSGGVPLEAAITSGNENNDVTFAAQSFVIAEGAREHTLTVDINDDGLVESDETVTFTLSKDASAVFPDAWGDLGTQTTFALTVTDNDLASVGFTTGASILLEGDSGSVLTVSMSSAVSQNVEVTLSESGDVNNDLAFSPASLTFAPGETSKQVTLTVNAANVNFQPEVDVDITYTLAGVLPDGVSFATREHVVTFTDDDKKVRFGASSSNVDEGTLGHSVTAVLDSNPPADGLELVLVAKGAHAADVSIPSPRLIFTGTTRIGSVLVDVLEDNIREDTEIVLLELEAPTDTPLPPGWTLLTSGNSDHDLTILPSDQAAMFAEAGRTADEGDGTISFQVELSAPAPSGGVPLEAAITSGNENGDVTFATQSFTIAEGASQHTLTVDVNDDDLVEPDETITFTLSKDASAVFPNAWGDLGTQTVFDLTITDNDSASVGFATASSSLLEDGSTAVLTVSLAGSVSQDVTVALNESGDVNNDLAFSPAALTFAPGETDKQVTLTVNAANNDALPEGDVEITYALTGSLPNGVSLATDSHVVTFIDDDKTVSFRDASSSATEGTTGHPVAVVLNFDPPADGLEVMATATGDHAADVSIPSPTLNFTGATRELPVLVDVLTDTQEEGAEIVLLELGETATPLPAGWTLLASGDNDHDLTILPNGQTAMFVEAGWTADEGDGTISFQVELSADAPAGGVPLEAAVTSGNENNDVTFTTQSFVIIEGERQHTLTVDINDDTLVEPDETVTFTLSKDASAVFPDAWGDLGTPTTFELTITNNDSATVGFAAAASTLLEGDTTAVLTVSMSNPVSQDVEVTLSESGDVNGDLAFSPAAMTFAPGETSKEVTLTVNAANNDTTPEGDVAITYTLAGTFPDNVSFAAGEHVVTFADDDRTISFRDASSSASEGTTGHPVAVALNFDPPAGGLEVAATATGDHAADVSIPSPTLNFTGTTRELPVLVNVLEDAVQEDAEIVLLELGETAAPLPAGWTLLASGDNDHDLTILPSDQTAMFAQAGRTADEGDGTISFLVELSADAPSGGVPLEAAITSGNDDGDVTFTTQSFVIVEGAREHTLTVDINDDALPESDETVVFTLSKDSSAVFPDAWGDLGAQTTFDLVITDNDEVSSGATANNIVVPDDKTIRFKDSSSSAIEGTTGHPVAVVLNFDPPAGGLEVAAVAKGDHKDDVSIPSPVLNFTGGTRELPVLVDVLNDIEQEDAEVVQLELEATALPADWTLVASGENDHDLTIEANDRTAEFADAGRAVDENAGTVSFRVILSADAPAGGVPLEAAITSGNENGDVTFATQSFTIAEGGREHTLTVDINEDNQVEPDEVVLFTLSKGGSFPQTWGDLGAQTVFDLTIRASDGSIEFAGRETFAEENSGEAMIALDVQSVPPADGLPMRVEIAGHGRHAETATADDYAFDPLAFTLMPAEAGEGYNLAFPIIDDDLPEKDETFILTLHAGEGFPVGWGELGGQTTHYLTILPNDNTIGFADTLPAEMKEGTSDFPLEVVWNADIENIKDEPVSIRLGVELEKAAGGGTDPDEPDVLLEVQSINRTFNEFQDTSHDSWSYTGSAGSDRRIEMNVNDDALVEEDEEIVVRLVPIQGYSLPAGWSIDPAEYRFTIPVNDKTVGFAAADSSLVENDGDERGEVSGNVVVKLREPAPAGGLNLVVSVDEETNDDGGNIDAEVTIGEGGVVFISEGTAEILLPVTALNDDIAESDEPVVLTLSRGANWPEGWEIGGFTGTGNLSATHTVTILGNDKKVGWREAVRKLVSEANYASVSPVVTNYPAPVGGLDLTVNVESHTGSYARADVRTDGSGDLSYRENVRIRPNSRFEGVNTVAPVDDGIAEPDEAAVFRLSVAGGGQLPPGWEWSNRDLEVILLANDNDFTFQDDQNRSAGSYSEGTTVRLTAVATNPLPPLESEEYYANFRTRVGYFGIEVTENSEDISITPVAPVIYHPDYHHPDGSRKGLSQPIKGGQEFFADYAFTVTQGDLNSLAFDVAIHEDSETEPPETVVITLSISGGWGLRPTTRQYTLTINDEGGTGMIGFREGEMPYGLYEKASLSTQRPGVLVELSSPSPAGGIDLVMRSSDPGQLLVGGNIHVPENRRGCYVTQLPVSGGSNYHFPEHRERCYFTDFNVVSDGIPEGDETYEIIISEDPARPLPPKWSIDSERSRREVTIYSSDNKVGIAGFVDPDSGSIPENGPIPTEMIKKSVSLDEDEGLARLVLNVPNDPVPGGLHLRLKVTPDATTPGASVADFDNIYRDNDFIIPRRNQAGPFQHVIEIPITDDTDAEQLESFSFALQFQYASGNHNTWGNVDWGNNSATLTILQNDPGTIGFSSAANEESIAEGSPHNVTIELSHPVPVPVLLDITVEESDGDGEADVGTSQTMLAFPANATEMPFSLNVIDDDLVEGEEEIVLRLQSGENFPNDMVTIAQETHTFTILGSDNIIEFKEPKSIQVGEGDGTLNFTLTLTNPAPEGGLPMRLEILTGNDFYATADDFTLAEFDAPFTITPEDGLEYTFSITITGNDGPESAERIYLFPVKAEGFPDGWGMVVEESYRISILKNDS